ncbi:hypothetical protein B0H67DRAFT_176248 [Lasiosphaeris hirsuta]|uniref:Zn(2)-C6 fungal-type domain-containing protein n=1 Tax=Lasiosphaeris hirsuta TaxID=260670 RepID=A0AA40AQG2_9PEZI|nr:hypothetical protein B0H67DRAFT_176248 [Lasiosphaeris hirsuta]
MGQFDMESIIPSGGPRALRTPPESRLPVARSREAPLDAQAESEAKRRKIRKGTRSCWECKRRKIRCTFHSELDAVCIGCRRRGTKCVSQEFPEEASEPADKGRQMGDRIVRVEALVEQLVKKVATNSKTAEPTSTDGNINPNPGIPTPGSTDSDRVLTLYESSPEGLTLDAEHLGSAHSEPPLRPIRYASAPQTKHERISEALFAAMPSANDLELIASSGGNEAIPFNQMITTPYLEAEKRGLATSEELFKLPDPNAHPVLLARYMLSLANLLHFLHSGMNAGIEGLSENPRAMMQRLIDTAISLVTTNDEMLGTVEGLECIMLEGLFQANAGNLRRAWLAFRRALVVGQLMGLHRTYQHLPLKVIEQQAQIYPQFIWHRIVYVDRTLCMMLGMPQGSLDRTMTSPAALASDTAMGRLERMHSVLASRILERNELDANSENFSLTQEIDSELQKAAHQLPGKWWLAPNLAASAQDSSLMFWETIRLTNQLFHYNLLNQLHLPYMLRSNSRPSTGPNSGRENYEYSKITCVTAGREILTRFIMFRAVRRIAFSCRAIDFYALMGAMTLLLAHLDGHRRTGGDNVLRHQRLSDRAMVEEVLEGMEGANRLYMDVLSEKSSELLRRLLAIEADAAAGRQNYSAESVSWPEAGNSEENVLRVCVPYFGTVKIAPEGVITKEIPRALYLCAELALAGIGNQDGDDGGNVTTLGLPGAGPEVLSDPIGEPPVFTQNQRPNQEPPQEQAQAPEAPTSSDTQHTPFTPQFPAIVSEAAHPIAYPGLTASVDDWAFQGVDMTFFNSIMRGIGTTEDGAIGDTDGDWGDWRNTL